MPDRNLRTFLAEHFLFSPRLSISSPTKGCGKTTLLDVLSRPVLRPLLASNVTPAAVFRVIEKYNPCLLIDEADTFQFEDAFERYLTPEGPSKCTGAQNATNKDFSHRRTAQPERRLCTWKMRERQQRRASGRLCHFGPWRMANTRK